MNVLLNGQILSLPEAQNLQNRGFRYGDGCFETILAIKGHSPLLAQHLARIRKSLHILGLQQPEKLNLEAQLVQLTQNVEDWQRVRLWLWRSGEGLYATESEQANFMLAAGPADPPTLGLIKEALVAQEVVLHATPWSFIKSISALPYVMAAKEKKEKQAEELILLNHRGEVVEATASNLFWKKRKRWYTPALDTGCVGGVMRAWLMQQLLEKGEPVFEVQASAAELQKADKLVCTNVTGLRPVQQLNGKEYETDITELWTLMPAAYRSGL